jgi:hypothetical protein
MTDIDVISRDNEEWNWKTDPTFGSEYAVKFDAAG